MKKAGFRLLSRAGSALRKSDRLIKTYMETKP